MEPIKSKIWRRTILIGAGILLLLLYIVVVFTKTKITKGPAAQEVINSKRNKVIEAKRGDVLAVDGRKLACSIAEYTIYMDPCADGLTDETFNSNIAQLSTQLAGFFKDKSAEQYRREISEARVKKRRHISLTPKGRHLSLYEKDQVKSFAILNRGANRGGYIEEERGARSRPFKILASRTVGDLFADKEKGGRVGIEQSFDEELRGVNGVGNLINVGGRWLERIETPAENGLDVHTTIDVDIQDVAEHSLMQQLKKFDAEYGVALLMEVKTGAVRAIVNLHRSSEGKYSEEYYNYAVGNLSEPGSTFKLANVMDLLEDGYVLPEDTINTFKGTYKFYNCEMKDSNKEGHGLITVAEGFEVSSNIAFSRLAMKYYKDNPQRFVDRLRTFGLCDSLCLDVKGEQSTDMKDYGESTWSGTTLPWMSIGYEVRLTPMQLLTFYNAVANGGVMMRPMLVQSLDRNGAPVKTFRPKVLRSSIASSSTIRKVKEMLKGVVEKGTAKNISNTPYKIAGKTGTAQIARGKGGYGGDNSPKDYLASFAGFFPADKPMYTCVVMVSGPKYNFYGNVVAGSVFKDIADRVYAAEYKRGHFDEEPRVEKSDAMPYSKGGRREYTDKVLRDIRVPHNNPDNTTDWVSTKAENSSVSVSSKPIVAGIMPDVRGMGAADAVNILESSGLRVRLNGFGHIRTQSIAPNERVVKGMTVALDLGY